MSDDICPALTASNKRWKRLTSLPRYEEIHQRLVRGESTAHVARVIQEEMQLCKGLHRKTLEHTLRGYRNEVIGTVLAKDQPGKDTLRELMTPHLKEQVDLYERWVWLINVQSERVARAANQEQKMRVLLPTLGLAIEQLRASMTDFLEFQLQTGLIRRESVRGDVSLKTLNYPALLALDHARREAYRRATKMVTDLAAGDPCSSLPEP